MNGHELKEKIIFLTKESIVDAQSMGWQQELPLRRNTPLPMVADLFDKISPSSELVIQIGNEKFASCLKQLLHEAKSDGVSRKEAYHAIYSVWLDLRDDIPEEIGDTLLDFLDVITFWVHPSCYIWPKDEEKLE